MTLRDLPEAIDSRIDSRLRGLHVGMPGRVESYDQATQRASVQPLVRRGYIDEEGNRQSEILPIVNNVPIIFCKVAAFAFTFPIAKGDGVWLQFSDFSLDEWLKHGGMTDPANDRNHALSDAVAFAGLNHESTDQVDSTAAVFAGELLLGSKDATDPVALKSDLDDIYTAITTAVTGASDGGATYKSNMKLILDAASFPVCSTKVKAE